ncbi:MAG TPA: twin-arginine translocase subunit TatC [Phycisphaerae bacterium]|nr:twin-arginine translocase subunit TatC [Phycisphaerae bacterium]
MRNDVEMTFGEHLEELRRRVIFALLGLLVSTVLCGVFYRTLLVALLRPYSQATQAMAPEGTVPTPPETKKPDATPGADSPAPPPEQPQKLPMSPGHEPRLILGGPLTGYTTIILLCVICGIILASPWILYQIWAFVGVGLHAREQRFVRIYGPFSFVLFVAGSATFYFVMLPLGLQALMSPTSNILVDGKSLIDASFFLDDYFKFVAMMTLIFGVVFQTPLIVMFLARTGIVPLGTLFKQQRVVILILCVLSAVFTPPDPVTMVMMAIPLIILYQLGLLLAWLAIRRKRQRGDEEEDEPWDDYERQAQGPWDDKGDAGSASSAPEARDAEEPAGPSGRAEEDPYADYHPGDDAPSADAPADAEPPPAPEAPPTDDQADPGPGPDDGIAPQDRMK